MKYILIILIATMVGCHSKKEPVKHLEAYTEDTVFITGQHAAPPDTTVCHERGHVWGERGYYGQEHFFYYSNTDIRIVDTPDSSYLMQPVNPEIKYCIRCEQDIIFPQPPKYIRTIWRKPRKKSARVISRGTLEEYTIIKINGKDVAVKGRFAVGYQSLYDNVTGGSNVYISPIKTLTNDTGK